MFEWSIVDETLTFSFDPGSPGLGFGDINNPATGGAFAGVIDSRG